MSTEALHQRSKPRVKALGEVFTQPRTVNAMLDLIPTSVYSSPESTWLEPACGTGNFLIEILKRKLSHHETGDKATHALRCLSGLYGIDISQINVQDCRTRLERFLGLAISSDEAFLARAKDILSHNIIKADSLKDADDILIWQYHWQGNSFTRTAHTLMSLI